MRRLLGILAVFASFAAVFGCRTAPTLRVATSGDYPPFSDATVYGAMVGFDTEVAAEFAHDTGRGMYFVPLRWPRLSDDADAGTFDVAMSGVTMRADRLSHMLFSRPYAVTGAVVAVRRERAKELSSLAEIDRPGVRLAVNRGGHLERVARARFPHADVLTIDDNRTLADRVLRGEVDGAVSEQIEVAAWPETFAVVGPFTRDRKVYAATPARAELLRELNGWLAAREADGWLNDQRRHWLSNAAAWTPDEACFEAIAAAIDLRMMLMPQVAAAKRQQNLPIEDPEQEAKVTQQAADWLPPGIDPTPVLALFRALMAGAKEVQGSSDTRAMLLADVDLDSLRRLVAFYSRSLVEELGRCQASLTRADAQSRLEAALRNGESFQATGSTLAAQLAATIARPYDVVAADARDPIVETIVEPSVGTYVEFCIPPNIRFDREGYSQEEVVGGLPLAQAPRRDLRSGRSRLSVPPGRHEYRIYVNGSSADPRRAGASARPSEITVDVPKDHVVTVRFAPKFIATGRFELRWQDVYGAAAGGLEAYRGMTRFDVEIAVSEPMPPNQPSQCPW
jgi:cyclohexadienyl dehydratase